MSEHLPPHLGEVNLTPVTGETNPAPERHAPTAAEMIDFVQRSWGDVFDSHSVLSIVEAFEAAKDPVQFSDAFGYLLTVASKYGVSEETLFEMLAEEGLIPGP